MAQDNFSDAVKSQIGLKSGFRCSNPACLAKTLTYAKDGKTVIKTGVIAHICAASPGGPRYDASMTEKERTSEENGILLCSECAIIVDRDVLAYPPERLKEWKKAAYQMERENHFASAHRMADPRIFPVIREMVRVCLNTYQTEGTVSKEARFRSYAGVLYRLLFVEMPKESDYKKAAGLVEAFC